MRVSVELPDVQTKGATLDTALAKQFADIQRQLMALVESKDAVAQARHMKMMASVEEQQSALVDALERLMGVIGKKPMEGEHADALASAIQGLKQTMAALPDHLKAALDQQSQAGQGKAVSTSSTPRVTVKMPQGFMARIDSLEDALVNGLRRSRSRTFGSNY